MSRARPATAPSTRSARTPGPPYCLILRGPLGVGKSTVAEALRRAEGAEVVSIDRLLEEHDLEEWDGDRISLRSFLRANRLAARRVAQARARTRSAIVEGNFYWAEQVDDLVGRLAPPVRVVRLEAPEAVCRARDAGRPAAPRGSSPRAGHRMGTAAVRDVYRMVAAVDRGTTVDGSGSVRSVTARVRGVLRRAGQPAPKAVA